MGPSSCLIFTAGTWCDEKVIKQQLASEPLVLACDGALAMCLERSVVPNAVIGDMDSVSTEVLERFVELGGEVVHRPNQASNDLAKALEYATHSGCSSCTVVGATGDDREHEWANLLTCAASTMDITCLGRSHQYRFLCTGRAYSIELIPGQNFSLFALPVAEGITLKGGKFGLENARLTMGSEGLHNVAVSSELSLTYQEGRLILLMVHPSSKEEGTT